MYLCTRYSKFCILQEMSTSRIKRGMAGKGVPKADVEPVKLEDRFAALESAIVNPKSSIHVDGLLVSHPVSSGV